MNLSKNENENENQYIWRLCDAKDKGLLDVNWDELGDIINKNLFKDDINLYRTSSAFRKPYQYARDFYKDVFLTINDNKYIEEINIKIEELKKEKYKLFDERSEYNRRLRNDARLEHRLDLIEQEIKKQGYEQFNFNTKNQEIKESNNDLLVLLSDLHIGATFDSFTGVYNSDIAKLRLEEYFKKIVKIANLNNSENCFISLQGDLISGSIHKSVVISNRENVIKQVMLAAELISNFISGLSTIFNEVFVTSVGGNHSRLDTKDDSLKDERLDDLIIWYLKSKLSHLKNIKFGDNIDSTFAVMNIRGKEYINLHGDYDAYSKSGIANLSMMLGHFPYAVTFGHLHTCAMSEEGGVKLIRGGSFAGSGDDYTVQKRLVGIPTQMVCVCTEDGIESYYEVRLNK